MTITLQTKSGEFAIEATPDEPVLHAGLRAGIRLPYECATGTCGTCRARVMTGDVGFGWDDAPGAAKIKREKGDVLMCQAVARGDCLLRILPRRRHLLLMGTRRSSTKASLISSHA